MNAVNRRAVVIATVIFGSSRAAETEGHEEVDEIVDNLLIAGFPESETEIRDGEVWVGGDVLVTLEASREVAGSDGEDEFRQYRTYSLWRAACCTSVVPRTSYGSTRTVKHYWPMENGVRHRLAA